MNSIRHCNLCYFVMCKIASLRSPALPVPDPARGSALSLGNKLKNRFSGIPLEICLFPVEQPSAGTVKKTPLETFGWVGGSKIYAIGGSDYLKHRVFPQTPDHVKLF